MSKLQHTHTEYVEVGVYMYIVQKGTAAAAAAGGRKFEFIVLERKKDAHVP